MRTIKQYKIDIPYGDFKDLTRRTASDKILCDKAFNIAKTPKYDGYQRGLASMVYKFFDKKSTSLADQLNLLLEVVLKMRIHQTRFFRTYVA